MIKSIIKRDGRIEDFKEEKIIRAVKKTFDSMNRTLEENEARMILKKVLTSLKTTQVSVEEVQDKVEESLMQLGYFDIAKSYIIYRNSRTNARISRDYLNKEIKDVDLRVVLKSIENDYPKEEYSLNHLINKYKSFINNETSDEDKMNLLIKAAVELTSIEAPGWEYIASRLYMTSLGQKNKAKFKKLGINNFYSKIKYLVDKEYYGEYFLDNYTEDEIIRCEKMIVKSRDKLLSYSAIKLLVQRYLIKDKDGLPLETVQEMFLAIAMHVAINEKDRLIFIKKLYDSLSKLEFIFSTSTLLNARKPKPQMASCYVDTMDDSLDSIFKSISNFSKVSKFGSGMGLYFGKIRSKGATIKDNITESNGVLSWIKIVNDVVKALDEQGIRNAAVACYLDAWHKDLPEFLQIKTSTNDWVLKAFEVYPAVCYPDYFWKQARDNINSLWYLMDPHEIYKIKNYHLEDYFGLEWENKYLECVYDDRIQKREVPIKEIIRLIIKSAVETGTPFCFNRDIVNRYNSNKHQGIIYCSNLCTEILQNTSTINRFEYSSIVDKNGDEIIIEKTFGGDLATSNLGSINLGKVDIHSINKLEKVIEIAIRALDAIIDLNIYPIEASKLNAKKYRSIGLGFQGYQELLAKENINWDSEEHVLFANSLFEKINYLTIKCSNHLALLKGSYPCFKGSEWENGNYFDLRGYNSEKWNDLKKQVMVNGIRNGYLLAISPNSSTSIINSSTAGVNPLINSFYFEEKNGVSIPRVAPSLNSATINFYKSGYDMNQLFTLQAASARQKHIDQSQSIILYITNDYSMRQLLELFIKAWELEIKTLYYVKTKTSSDEQI